MSRDATSQLKRIPAHGKTSKWSMMKRVCIVGAGPAGLVAAKTFLRTGQFAVTVYEKNARIGGIWALDEDTKDGYLAPRTPTNLSRFTVGFSDLDWRDLDLRSKRIPELACGDGVLDEVPIFPKAWQANRYLEEYRKRYVSDGVIKLGTRVTRATRHSSHGEESSSPSWSVDTMSPDGECHTEQFDYILMASGFFSSPRWPKPAPAHEDGAVSFKEIHSSQFRTLEDLFPDDSNAAGMTVLLIGGGNSAGETAAAVAMQLSDAAWSPDTSRRKRYEGCKVVHVTPRPIYGIPPNLEYEKGSLTYVPIDFKLYDFARRPLGMDSYAGNQTMEVRDLVHVALQGMIGGDQADLGSEALRATPKGEGRGAVYVALSESYTEFVRSGLIEVKAGRVTSISDGADGMATAAVGHGGEHSSVDNVGAVIYATGYTPSTALDFLAADVKDRLMYDPTSTRLPLILDQWQTMNSAVPDAAFLGFYEGPYWPMMEMQARLTADRWMNGNPAASQRPYEEIEKLVQLRQAMQEKALDVPQYWFGDYLGYMEDIAAHLKLDRNDGPFADRVSELNICVL